MRTNRRFTPQLLDKWEFEQGRGGGIQESYQPWHQVTRADPASRGNSHLILCPKTQRLRHLLSEGEKVMLSFAWMVPYVVDIREQFKLDSHGHDNVLSAYHSQCKKYMTHGTVDIAADLKVKHPRVKSGSFEGHWRLSSDLLLTIRKPNKLPKLCAVAFKHESDLNDQRKRELLRIEEEFWRREGGEWLLITPQQYKPSVAATVKSVFPWVFHPEQASIETKIRCAEIVNQLHGFSLRNVFQEIRNGLSLEVSKVALIFYQAVWTGLIPLDLSRSRFQSDPINLITTDQFWQQNPIVTRRSAW